MWDTLALEWLARAAAGGFVILAVAALAVRLCRQPADRVRVIALALVAAVCVPWLAMAPAMPRWSLAVLPAKPQAAPAAPEPVGPALSSEPTPAYRPTNPEPIPQAAKLKPEETAPQPAATATAPAGPETVAAPLAEEVAATPAPSWWTAGRAVLVGYAALTAALLVWSLMGLCRLFLLWRSARPAPAEAVSLLRQLVGRGADRVTVLVSDRIESPIAFAGWRPVIVLPASADGESLRYGLAHEWSHVERRDVWRWYLVAAAQIVLFYQPLFWWLRRQLRLSQDYLADARAAGEAPDTVDYAEYLVALARRRLGVPGLALGITDRRSNLTRRVHMLLLNHTPLSRRCRVAWTCGAAAVALGLLVAFSGVSLTAAPASQQKGDDTKKPADPPKGETVNYTGKVTDKDTGKAIAGAVVTVRRSLLGDPEAKGRNEIMEESKHTTDAEGKYSFVIPPEQSAKRYLYIELDVEHPDYASRKGFGYSFTMIRKNEKLGGRPFFESVEMRPAQPITGLLRTPEGKPAAGVKVLAYSVTNKRKDGEFEYGSFADTKTDAEGKFRLPITTPGWAVYWVLPEHYIPTTNVIKDKRGDLGVITLLTGPRIKGTLLDAKGKPLAGVIVNADSQDRNEEITEPVADSINRSAVTNDKGEFVMNPLPPGKYVVKPGDYPHDGSLDRNDRKRGEVPGVFLGTKLTLKAGADPEPIEVRAVPHVTIEGQFNDSAGKPTRGHAPFIFGELDGVSWFGEAKVDANGKLTANIPHGLEQVQLDLMTNEHGALRWRKAKGEPLNNSRRVMLGTLNEDVKGIEIIRYVAPIVIVKITTKDGSKPVNPGVTAEYGAGKGQNDGRFILRNGRQSDVSFEQQEDGRFRSSQLFPDEDVTVFAHADGYVSKSEKVKLAEGTTKEIELVLEKEPAKKEEKKDK